jgi:hypothetical protein
MYMITCLDIKSAQTDDLSILKNRLTHRDGLKSQLVTRCDRVSHGNEFTPQDNILSDAQSNPCYGYVIRIV